VASLRGIERGFFLNNREGEDTRTVDVDVEEEDDEEEELEEDVDEELDDLGGERLLGERGLMEGSVRSKVRKGGSTRRSLRRGSMRSMRRWTIIERRCQERWQKKSKLVTV
jgi:hypothetical protein